MMKAKFFIEHMKSKYPGLGDTVTEEMAQDWTDVKACIKAMVTNHKGFQWRNVLQDVFDETVIEIFGEDNDE